MCLWKLWEIGLFIKYIKKLIYKYEKNVTQASYHLLTPLPLSLPYLLCLPFPTVEGLQSPDSTVYLFYLFIFFIFSATSGLSCNTQDLH